MTNVPYGKQLLTSLKYAAGTPGLQIRLQATSSPAAWLRPVATRRHLQNQNDIGLLTDWRNRFVTSFLNEFMATNDRTSRWLADVVDTDDNRILFMIDDIDSAPIGYIGLAFINWETGYAEADSVVRGKPGPKGVMARVLQMLITWGKSQLGLQTFGVRVRSDNPALDFYRKCGFIEHKRVPLSLRTGSDALTWYEDPASFNAAVSLVYHTLSE